MARLEYRLKDEAADRPPLFAYPSIGREEIAMRFARDYLVKGGVVYERTAGLTGERGNVVYVQTAEEETAYPDSGGQPDWEGIRIELRRYSEEAIHYPLIRTMEFAEPMEALLRLQADQLLLDGCLWQKTSAEIDEDRKVYVYYAQEVQANG